KAGKDDVGHCERQKKLPAEAHELVITKTWQCTEEPDVQQEEREDFDDKPEDGKDGCDDGASDGREEIAEGAGWTTEEEQGGDAGYGDHVGVLGHEENRELHGGVLGVVT